MGTPISAFTVGGLLRTTDIIAGLRGTTGSYIDNQFSVIGIGDSLGANLITWTAGAGPNVNYINFQSSTTGNPVLITARGSDTNVNMTIGDQGAGIVTIAGTSNIVIPAGTAGQALPSVGGGIRYNTTSQYLDYWSTVSSSWVDLTTGSALSNLTFVTNTDETAFAPNSQALSLLSTGMAFVTTTTGIVGTRTLTGTANEVSIANGTGSGGNPTFSLPSAVIAPGTLAAVTSVSAPEYLLTGATDGVISILPQAHAGTFNFNLPVTAGTSGYLLTSAGGGSSPMTWSNIASIAVSSIAGTANEITASASTGAVTLSIPSNAVFPGIPSSVNYLTTSTSTVSSGATTTLTVGSTQKQVLTGSSGQTYKLPDATTLTVGCTFEFNNNSSMICTIEDNGATPLYYMASGAYTRLILLSNGSAAGTWDEHSFLPSNCAFGNNGATISGTLLVTTSISTPEYFITGSGSGTISILPQAAAGTYNFNLPTTAGTSGYLLTSAGGGSSPMTWTQLSGVAVTSISGTANEITASASTGAVTLSIPSTFIAPGTIQATTSSAATSFLLNGSGSGTISILPQSAAGTYNFNLPITAGTSGYVLTSAGGGSSAMTWTNLGSAAVTSIAGTANQITASGSTGAVTLSIPSTFIAPGSIAVGDFTLATATMSSSNSITLSPATIADGIDLAGNTFLSSGSILGLYESTNTHLITFSASAAASNANYTLPPALPGGNGYTISSTTAGVWTWVAPGTGVTGRLLSFQTFTSGTAQTYTPTSSAVNNILVECVGGGGAGGSCASAGAGAFVAAGGGGGGGYVRYYLTNIGGSYTATYTVGGGGSPGAAGNHPGGAGAATTYSDSGGTSLSAGGGAGGSGTATSIVASIVAGGAGGAASGSGASMLVIGGAGTYGIALSITAVSGGAGGRSVYGNNVAGALDTDAGGATGQVYGGGGSGCAIANANDNQGGGGGGSGIITIWEFS